MSAPNYKSDSSNAGAAGASQTPGGQTIGNETGGKTNPDATDEQSATNVDPAHHPGTMAKAVGGGLEPGSTDFGSPTSPMHGGRSGAGSQAGRTYAGSMRGAPSNDAGELEGDDPGPSGGSARMGANGGSVLATGRPTRDDARAAIGGEPATASPNPDRPSDQSIRSAAGTTSIGNIGGGTAGSGNSNARDRTADITGDPVSAPNFVGAGSTGGTEDVDQTENQRDAYRQEMKSARESMPKNETRKNE